MKEMGKRIKKKREELGFTMEELGALLHVNKSTISKWERGAVDSIKRSHLDSLAYVLHCSPKWLMGFDDDSEVNIVYSADGAESVTAIVDTSKPLIGSESERAQRAMLYKIALDVKPENLQAAIDILKALI